MKKLAKYIDEEKGSVYAALSNDLNIEYLLKQGFIPMELDDRPFQGVYYVKGKRPADPVPTREEISELRERAYEREVDGKYTAQIQRLRDEEQTEELQAKIAELIKERAIKVEEIKQRYPYQEEGK